MSLPSVAKDPEQDFACEDSIPLILCGEGQGEEKPRNPKCFLGQLSRLRQGRISTSSHDWRYHFKHFHLSRIPSLGRVHDSSPSSQDFALQTDPLCQRNLELFQQLACVVLAQRRYQAAQFRGRECVGSAAHFLLKSGVLKA
jgi:hypothetical protein